MRYIHHLRMDAVVPYEPPEHLAARPFFAITANARRIIQKSRRFFRKFKATLSTLANIAVVVRINASFAEIIRIYVSGVRIHFVCGSRYFADEAPARRQAA